MALSVLNLWELHHPAARVLPRSSPRLSRRTPSTSARIDASDTSGVSATTPELPPILGRFMKAHYSGASLHVSSVSPLLGRIGGACCSRREGGSSGQIVSTQFEPTRAVHGHEDAADFLLVAAHGMLCILALVALIEFLSRVLAPKRKHVDPRTRCPAHKSWSRSIGSVVCNLVGHFAVRATVRDRVRPWAIGNGPTTRFLTPTPAMALHSAAAANVLLVGA